MTFPVPYPKAPIVEALVELRVSSKEPRALDDLLALRFAEENAYPELQAQFGIEQRIQVGAAVTTETHHERVGHVLVDAGKQQIVQVAPLRFAFSRLAPYQSWEPFMSEAVRLFDAYQRIAHVDKIDQLAVRYINRIDVPLASVELKDYLLTGPEISRALPQGLDAYFFQVRLPLPEFGVATTINETIAEPAHPGVTALILDIEVSRDTALDPGARDVLEGELEQLRAAKNFVFESCITDASRRLFY